MDEQECIFEIVDGVLTIVPKDQSPSTSIGRNGEQIGSSKHQNRRSSSIASSESTPSLSEQEQERDELSSISSSKPFALLHETSKVKLSSPPSHHQIEQSVDVLDLFSTPLIPIHSTKKSPKTLFDESLSSVSSYGDRPNQIKKRQTSIPRSSSPINHKPKSSSIKGKKSFYKYL